MWVFYALLSLAGSLLLLNVQSQFTPGADELSDLFVWKRPSNASKLTGIEASILQEVSQILPQNEFFFGLNPRHRLAVTTLENVLMEQPSPREWLQLAEDLRDREEMNPHVWLRAVMSSIVHRRDIPQVGVPPIAEVIPSLFFTTEILEAVKNQTKSTGIENGKCVIVDESQGVSYTQFVILGELFYWMHHDVLARYQSERLSVGLPPVVTLNMEPKAQLPPKYNPHLNDRNSNMNWTPRPADAILSDVNSDALTPGSQITISVMNRSAVVKSILDGISEGYLVNMNDQPILLNTLQGLNSLGNIVQANGRSETPDKYGISGVHNDGHILISLVMDPREYKGLTPGVMGDTATAMRDVIFYPYHDSIDKIFEKLKSSLPSYKLTQGELPLLLTGISIQKITTQTQKLPPNQLQTFWSTAKFDLSKGLDLRRSPSNGPLEVCVKHLNHEEFQYQLTILRGSQQNVGSVTVRIFMGPRYDLNGRRYSLEEQRQLMFVLDRFTVSLKVGANYILRNSTDTPLTIGFRQSLRELQNGTDGPYCGCGWPHYFLLPKGNQKGLSFGVFAILTDAAADTVKVGENIEAGEDKCRPAHVYSGLDGRKYPDAKPMGYPFDRKLYVSDYDSWSKYASLDALVREVTNAAYVQVTVTHFDEFRQKPGKV